jgi:hypothetical protein
MRDSAFSMVLDALNARNCYIPREINHVGRVGYRGVTIATVYG